MRTLTDPDKQPPILPVRVTEATYVPIKHEDGTSTKFNKDKAETSPMIPRLKIIKRDTEWKEIKSKVFEIVQGLCSESVIAAVMSSQNGTQLKRPMIFLDSCSSSVTCVMILMWRISWFTWKRTWNCLPYFNTGRKRSSVSTTA